MKTYTITEAAKRTCRFFGIDSRGVIIACDKKSRQMAENAFLEQLKLGTIVNEDTPHENFKKRYFD